MPKRTFKLTAMVASKDNIYLYDEALADFVFDDNVAAVFTDMINRSVPGYALMVRLIAIIAARYAKADTNLYDLGCSLGAVSFLLRQLELPGSRVIGVDNSAAMLERCENYMQQGSGLAYELRCEDVQITDLQNASVVVLNFTLQFIAPAQRDALIARIYLALNPGGVLIVSEKVVFDEADKQELFVELHHRFKQANGYSEMEISRKRLAIENVLIPETVESHRQRFKAAGFTQVELWCQCFNFVSLFAVK